MNEFCVEIIDPEILARLVAGLNKRMPHEFRIADIKESYSIITARGLNKYECQLADRFIDGFRWRTDDVEFW